MPLRGKLGSRKQEIIKSQEIKDLATAMGVNPGETDLSNLRYGKICILADATQMGYT